jgi:hypothetical protein
MITANEILKLFEAYQLPDWAVNLPNSRASINKRIYWCYDILGVAIRKERQATHFDKKIAALAGRLKLIIAGKVKDLIGDLDVYNWEDRHWDNPDKSMSSEDQDFLAFVTNQAGMTSKQRISKDYKKSFEKVWKEVIDLLQKMKKEEGLNFKWKRFLSRIAGQSNPKLSLKDQFFLKNERGIPAQVWEFLTGDSKRPDLSAESRLDTSLDLFVYPKLPAGGRIAQTIPELLLISFFRNLKEQRLGATFSINDFVKFIKRFIGEKIFQKWNKTSAVYRLGPIKGNRDWFPASTTLDGVKRFISTMNLNKDELQNLEVHYGKVNYFDMYGYMEWLTTELQYPFSDPEHEVLIPKKTKLNKSLYLSWTSDGWEVTDEPIVVNNKVKETFKIKVSPGRDYDFTTDSINDIKVSYKKHGVIDISIRNSVLITTDTKASVFNQYVEKGWMVNKELSKLVGTKVWTGYWN